MMATPTKLLPDIALDLQADSSTSVPHGICISDADSCNSWKQGLIEFVPRLGENKQEVRRLDVPSSRCSSRRPTNMSDASTALPPEASIASTSEGVSRERGPAASRKHSQDAKERRGKNREHGHRRRRLSEPAVVSYTHREDPLKISFETVEAHPHRRRLDSRWRRDALTPEEASQFKDMLPKFTRCGGHSTRGITGGRSIQDSKILQEGLRHNKFLPPTFFQTDAAQRENLRQQIHRQSALVERRLVELLTGDKETERDSMITPRSMNLFKNRDKSKREYADVQDYISRRVCKPLGSE